MSTYMENRWLVENLLPISRHEERFLLGITGPPGSGKTTLAGRIRNLLAAQGLADRSVVVPMDGFHYQNDELDAMGLLDLKGVPATFNAEAFVQLIKDIRLRPDQTHWCPQFDRRIETSIPNAIAVEPRHRIVVVEGNYLLLQAPPWCELRNLFDEIWFIDVPMETIRPRLLQRHVSGGKTTNEALRKMESTDLPNAKLIAQTQSLATRVVQGV